MSSALDQGSIVIKSSTEEPGKVKVREGEGSKYVMKAVISLTNLRFRGCKKGKVRPNHNV
jgi:hypothetical protein